MSNRILTLPSGATLEIQMAPFSVGAKVYKTIANELKSADIGSDIDLSNLGGIDLNDLKTVFFQLLGSDALELAVFECFKYTVCDGEKGMTRATFEPEDRRGDYLVAAWEVLKLNVSPFFKSLGSVLSGSVAPSTEGRK